MKKFARKDSITGKGMNSGYCYMDGDKYFENKEDLVKEIRNRGDEEFNSASDEFILKEAYDCEEYYWTEWEPEAENNWYDEEGNEYTICHNCNEETEVKEDFDFCSHCLTHL